MGEYYLEVVTDKLKMYTTNSKATSKIVQQRILVNKSPQEIKWIHKKKFNSKEVRKQKKMERIDETHFLKNQQDGRLTPDHINNLIKYKWSKHCN